MSEVFDESAYNYPMYKVASDGLSMTIDYTATIAGQSFESGITDALSGELVQAITCTVIDAGAGTLVLSLTGAQTVLLANRNLRWYYTRTVGGIPRTELAGISVWSRK